MDGPVAEEDPEGLDSDTEDEARMDKELGIDLDDVEGEGSSWFWFVVRVNTYYSTDAYCPPLLSALQ